MNRVEFLIILCIIYVITILIKFWSEGNSLKDKIKDSIDIINDAVKEQTEEPINVATNIVIDFTIYEYRHMKQQYLESKKWKDKRKQVLKRDNYKCTSCGASGVPLSVHHTSGYNLIPNEPIDCLKALCESCHTLEHKLYGFPQTYKEYMEWNHPITSRK